MERAGLWRSVVLGAVLALTGCVAQHKGDPQAWFAASNAVSPDGTRVFVCHGFGCLYKTAFRYGPADLARMRAILGRPQTAAAEREGLARLVAWAETRVAETVGSAGDVGGLDIANAGTPGQMDCIDEAANTTSTLLVAERLGLLRHHRVTRPVARGFFLDGRYPHATATVADTDGVPWAVDSWPRANGERPVVMPLETWFAQSRASQT